MGRTAVGESAIKLHFTANWILASIVESGKSHFCFAKWPAEVVFTQRQSSAD
jgi:hypothetical protein